MRTGYFPGCSLKGGGVEYETSLKTLMDTCNVQLIEIEGWNCCGASSAHSVNHRLAVALPARNIALAAENNLSEILVPCAACFIRFKNAWSEITKSETEKKGIENLIGRKLPEKMNIFNINEFLRKKLFQSIRDKIKTKMNRTRVACYYGCLLVRPPELAQCDTWENPQVMEEMIRLTGAETVEWPYKIECCGGGFTLSKTEYVVELIKKIILNAKQNGADTIVTGCPMCHSNLDMRQLKLRKDNRFNETIPILYITEFLGLSLGQTPRQVGLNNHFISSKRLLNKIFEPGIQ
jgi:heterodisulfide reductase subunit B